MVNSFVIFIEILKLCSQTGDFSLITVLELPPSRRIKKGDLLKPQHKTKFYNIRSKFTFSLNETELKGENRRERKKDPNANAKNCFSFVAFSLFVRYLFIVASRA